MLFQAGWQTHLFGMLCGIVLAIALVWLFNSSGILDSPRAYPYLGFGAAFGLLFWPFAIAGFILVVAYFIYCGLSVFFLKPSVIVIVNHDNQNLPSPPSSN